MKSALEAIEDALEEHDNRYKKEIIKLQERIKFLENERSLIRKNLEEGNIENLMDYFMIGPKWIN